MVNVMLIVGSSISIGISLSGFSKSAMVSPISNPSIPVNATISPAATSSVVFCFPNPSNVKTSLILIFTIFPSLFTNDTG